MVPFDKKLFIKRMNARRKQLQMPYRVLVEKTGISMAALNGYVLGRTLPNIVYAYSIAAALGVTMDWLCGYDRMKEEFKNERRG